MEHASYTCAARLHHHPAGVVLGIAGVDDERPAFLRGETQLRRESGDLRRTR